MTPGETIRRFGGHQNNFGFLRLLLAALVIISHSFALKEGNALNDPLMRLFGTIDTSAVAVDCFFLISGYLIAGSFLSEPKAGPYLIKRVLRIYPAFAAASLVCLFIVAPLGGAKWELGATALGKAGLRLIQLGPPDVPGAFEGSFYPVVNGAMWTIAIEFRCYLLILVLGMVGILRRAPFVAAIALTSLVSAMFVPDASWERLDRELHFFLYAGSRHYARFVGIFLVGSLFLLWRAQLKARPIPAIVASVALLLCLLDARTTHAGIAVFGGYLLFAFAHLPLPWLAAINNRNDVSYGVYLYGWPIEKLLFWYLPLSVAAGAILTIVLAYGCGWISWRAIEKPALRAIRNRTKLRSGNAESVREQVT